MAQVQVAKLSEKENKNKVSVMKVGAWNINCSARVSGRDNIAQESESTNTSLKASSPGLLVNGPAIPGPIAFAPGSAADGLSSVKERPKKARPRTVLSLGACFSLSQ